MVDPALILWPIWFTVTMLSMFIPPLLLFSQVGYILYNILGAIIIGLLITAVVFTVQAQNKRKEDGQSGLGPSAIMAIVLTLSCAVIYLAAYGLVGISRIMNDPLNPITGRRNIQTSMTPLTTRTSYTRT